MSASLRTAILIISLASIIGSIVPTYAIDEVAFFQKQVCSGKHSKHIVGHLKSSETNEYNRYHIIAVPCIDIKH